MALEYGYFDSEITGYDEEGMPVFDRAKTSDFMADFFSKLISSGVLANPSDNFQVLVHEGMTVKVRPGYAYIKGRFAYDIRETYLTLAPAPEMGAYARIDRIVLRNNYAERLCEIVLKTGEESVNPEAPELVRAEPGDYYELSLATIRVNAYQKSIFQMDITDTRLDTSVCGIVTNLVNQVDTKDIFLQFQSFLKEFESEQMAKFMEWFETIKETLSDAAAGELLLEVERLRSDIGDLAVIIDEINKESV